MKNTKKILGIVLVIMLLALAMSISVFAADDTEYVAKVVSSNGSPLPQVGAHVRGQGASEDTLSL